MPVDQKGCEFIRSGGLGAIAKVIYWNYPSPWEYGMSAHRCPRAWTGTCGAVPPRSFRIILNSTSHAASPAGSRSGLFRRRVHRLGATAWTWCSTLGHGHSGRSRFGPRVRSSPPSPTRAGISKRGNSSPTANVFFKYANGVVLEPAEKAPKFGATFIGEKGRMTVDRGSVKSEPKELAEHATKGAGKGGDHIGNWLHCIKHPDAPSRR